MNDNGEITSPAQPDRSEAPGKWVLRGILIFWIIATPVSVAMVMRSESGQLLPVVCVLGAAGAVGTLRQVYWGRMSLLFAHVIVSMVLSLDSIPDWDTKAEDLTSLQRLVAEQVPLPVGIALVIALCVLPMIPLLFVARPSAGYRRAWW